MDRGPLNQSGPFSAFVYEVVDWPYLGIRGIMARAWLFGAVEGQQIALLRPTRHILR